MMGVQGGHGETGAVDHAADIAVELDVGTDAGLLGLDLHGVFLVEVAPVLIALAEGGVVVQIDLGVEGEHAVVLGEDARIDLGQQRVGGDEGAVEAGEELAGLEDGLFGHAELLGELAAAEGREALGGVDGEADDGGGVALGDLFDGLSRLRRRRS